MKICGERFAWRLVLQRILKAYSTEQGLCVRSSLEGFGEGGVSESEHFLERVMYPLTKSLFLLLLWLWQLPRDCTWKVWQSGKTIFMAEVSWMESAVPPKEICPIVCSCRSWVVVLADPWQSAAWLAAGSTLNWKRWLDWLALVGRVVFLFWSGLLVWLLGWLTFDVAFWFGVSFSDFVIVSNTWCSFRKIKGAFSLQCQSNFWNRIAKVRF